MLQTAPDLNPVCAAAVGCLPVDVQPIGNGANSRVFRVSFDAGVPPVVVKFYRRDPGDGRDRLAAEFGGLQFLWSRGIHLVPRPIAQDRERYCGVYGFIAGEVPESHAASLHDIESMVAFLGELRSLSKTASEARTLPAASEACFSLGAIAENVRHRVERLRNGAPTADRRPMLAWIDERFEPLFDEIVSWVRRESADSGIGFDADIPPEARTLSPSDFGFHNAIRRPDGLLAFVDFEYFGWDDPAKTVADFLLHPGMTLAPAMKRHFARVFVQTFFDEPILATRARLAYPLFGLKWCAILLNEFLTERLAARPGPEGSPLPANQLVRANQLAGELANLYSHNTFFTSHD